jgi:phospholipid-transporting ATPase
MDGETDNKYRRALEATAGSATDIKLNSNEEIANLDGIIECETPNNKTNDFSGALYDLNRNNLGNITCESVLMRGCTLRNTDWVYGVVVTTGKMCKIEFRESQSNLCGDKNAKVPSINKLINREIVVLVLVSSNLTTNFIFTLRYSYLFISIFSAATFYDLPLACNW